MVRIAVAVLLKTDPELAIYGRYVVPDRLIQMGFKFEYPEIESAIKDLVA